MGSSRLSSVGGAICSTIDVLELLSEPDGLKKVIAQLKTERDQTLAALEEANQKHELIATDAIEKRNQLSELADKSKLKEVELTTKNQDLSDWEARLVEQDSKLAKLRKDLDKQSTDLTTAQKEFQDTKARSDQALIDKSQELDATHDLWTSNLDKKIEAHQAVVEKNLADFDKQKKDYAQAVSGLQKREEALKEAEVAAASIQAEYAQKIAKFQALIENDSK